MTHYYPCRGCAENRLDCPRLAEVKVTLAGLGVTSIKFKCILRKPYFFVGQRVTITLPFYDDYESHLVWFKGTVVSEVRPSRFKVKIDDGPDMDGNYDAPKCTKSGTGYVSVRSEFITNLDEPNLEVCRHCEIVGGGHTWPCSDYGDLRVEDITGI